MVGFGVEIDLQFLYFCEVDFIVVDVYFGHDFTVVIAQFSIDLSN